MCFCRLCFMSDRCFSQPFRKPQTKPQPMGKHNLISACAGLSHLRISGEPKPELSRPPCSPCEHLPLDVRGEAKRFPGCDRRYQLFPAMFVAKKPTRGRRIGYFLLPRMLMVLLVLFPPGVWWYVKDTPSAPRRGAAGSTCKSAPGAARVSQPPPASQTNCCAGCRNLTPIHGKPNVAAPTELFPRALSLPVPKHPTQTFAIQ